MKQFLSENQLLLLRLFLTNPEKSFYMHETGRILGKKPGVFQRTLNALVEEGWLRSEYRAHARFFQANTRHPLYPELKRIVAKTVGVEGALRDLVHRLPDVKMALLYGPFAKGGQRKNSDVDLLIVGTPRAESKLVHELARLEKQLQREINYKLYSEGEYRRKRREREPFLQDVLTDRAILLKGDPHAV
jgi:predicted nucleotidyltransferase